MTREMVSRSRWPRLAWRVADMISVSIRSPAYPYEGIRLHVREATTDRVLPTRPTLFATEDPGKRHRVTFMSRRTDAEPTRITPRTPRPAACTADHQHGDSKELRCSGARARGHPRRVVARTPSAGSWEAGAPPPLRESPDRRPRCARRSGAGPMGQRWWREHRRIQCGYPMRLFAGEP